MGVMARHVIVFCALLVVLLQLILGAAHSYGAAADKLSTPDKKTSTVVLRSSLVRKDSLQTAKSPSERFLEAVKHSQRRFSLLQKKLRLAAGLKASVEAEPAVGLQIPVSYGVNAYVMPISLGTPPQQFIVEIDTGSELCWVQCAPCLRCYQGPNVLFNPMTSSSYSQAGCNDSACEEALQPSCSARNTCAYYYEYADGSSTSGVLSFDALTLDNSAVSSHFVFGCGHNNGGTFEDDDGLMGFNKGALSLPSQLSPSGGKVFSYCLVEQLYAGTRSSPLTFGNAPEHSNVSYTPMVTNPSDEDSYYLDVTGITIGGQRLRIPASTFQIDNNGVGGVLLDSGTTITYWRPAAFNRIIEAFRQQVAYPEVDADPYGLNLCYDVSSVSPSSLTFPDMVVHMMNEVHFEIPPLSLFQEVIHFQEGNVMCLTMAPQGDASLIGNVSQENNLIVYDIDNQRIGFQKIQCDTL